MFSTIEAGLTLDSLEGEATGLSADTSSAIATGSTGVPRPLGTDLSFFSFEQYGEAIAALTSSSIVFVPVEINGIALTQLFDEIYYLNHNPDIAAAVEAGGLETGYDHFIEFGWREGRNPSALYSETLYLEKNPDVAAAVAEGSFNSGLDHFLHFGHGEERAPGGGFNPQEYLAKNADADDAIATGTFSSAFEHWLEVGIVERRFLQNLLFDEIYYRWQNPDVADAVDAGAFVSGFSHFIQFGSREGRNPSSNFSEDAYLGANPDAAADVTSGRLPSAFAHYLTVGARENRLLGFDPADNSLSTARPFRGLDAIPQIAVGEINRSDTIDSYRFTLTDASVVDIELKDLSADADVYVISDENSDGRATFEEIIAQSVLSGSEAETISTALTAGEYFIQVERFSGDTAYTLSAVAVAELPVDPAGQDFATAQDLGVITTPVTITESVGGLDSDDFYRFRVEQPAALTATLADLTSDLDIYLLQDTNGNGQPDDTDRLAASVNGGTDSEDISLGVLPGDYFLHVSAYEGESPYRLDITLDTSSIPEDSAGEDGPTASPLGEIGIIPQKIAGFVGAVDPLDTYRFTLGVSSSVRIDLTDLRADADLVLLADLDDNGLLDDAPLATSLNGGSTAEQILRSLDAGIYYLQVRQYFGDTNYRLDIQAIPN